MSIHPKPELDFDVAGRSIAFRAFAVLSTLAFLLFWIVFDMIVWTPQQNFSKRERKAAAGDVRSQYLLGQWNEYGMSRGGAYVRQDEAKALIWYQKAARQRYAPAYAALGELYERRQDNVQAVRCYTEGARLGSQDAQRRLAQVYEQGLLGQAIDKVTAVRLRQQSSRHITADPL